MPSVTHESALKSADTAAGRQPLPERLCENCGTVIQGAYCHRCGQPSRSFIKAVPAVVRDVANDTLSYDSRLWRTLSPLLFSPGRLSSEYVSGRRARYTPPFRLYLISSLLAFLIVNLSINTSGVDQWSADQPVDQDWKPSVQFGAEPWHPQDNPVTIRGLGHAGNAWLNRQVGKLIENSREIRNNPGRFVRNLIGLLPQMMFALLPVYALLVQLCYLFAGRYYIEHLILQVHNHAFLFLAMILMILLSALSGVIERADLTGSDGLSRLLGWSVAAISLWLPIYLFISLKRFYRQGWMLTSLKFILLSLVYITLFSFAMLFTGLIGVLSL